MPSDPDSDDVQDRLTETEQEPEAASTGSLTDIPVGITHPSRRGGRVTDEAAVAAWLTLTDKTLRIRVADNRVNDADGDGDASNDAASNVDLEIRFSDIVYCREGQQEVDGAPVESLSIRHLQPPASAMTTELSAWDDADHDRLTEVVSNYYRQQREAVGELEPTDQQLELLVRLYSLGGEIDPSAMLSRSPAELAELFDPLREAGLISKGDTGVFLTGRGYLLVNERMDDETM